MTSEDKVKAEFLRLTGLTLRFDGVRKQYDAAVLEGNNALADVFRQQLHELLDMMLDCSANSMSITRQLIGPNGNQGPQTRI